MIDLFVVVKKQVENGVGIEHGISEHGVLEADDATAEDRKHT